MPRYAVKFEGWIIVEDENEDVAVNKGISSLATALPDSFDGIAGDVLVVDGTEEVAGDTPLFDKSLIRRYQTT